MVPARRAPTEGDCVRPPIDCAPVRDRELSSLRAVVAAYIRDYRQGARRGLRFYAGQRTLEDAVTKAALCVTPSGKRHSHQRRIPRASLELARRSLLTADLRACGSFEDLHELVRRRITDIHMVGPLVVYDVAQRIGGYLGLEPDSVYLHRGTKEGAGALGLDTRRGVLTMEELPLEFRRLSPAEVEDCLCIYKQTLSRLAAGRSRKGIRGRR